MYSLEAPDAKPAFWETYGLIFNEIGLDYIKACYLKLNV